ncbi:hypothetical protein BC827DRAFT_1232503 [Russula dissimulans]|nr:hypothetical protein BC827DRAFT_1232503 [Russula dissimulans]
MDRRSYVAAGAAAGVALTPVVAPILVGAVGFGAAGPVAGTLATIWQASIGNVVAGSAFAVAQSIGMGGAIPIGISAIGAAIGAVAGASAGGGENDAGAGTAGEDGAPPGGPSGARTGGEKDGARPVTASPASTASGESMAGEDTTRPPTGRSTASIAGATNARGEGADADSDADDPAPVGLDVPRTELDRCDRCKRKHKRYCWHPDSLAIAAIF